MSNLLSPDFQALQASSAQGPPGGGIGEAPPPDGGFGFQDQLEASMARTAQSEGQQQTADFSGADETASTLSETEGDRQADGSSPTIRRFGGSSSEAQTETAQDEGTTRSADRAPDDPGAKRPRLHRSGDQQLAMLAALIGRSAHPIKDAAMSIAAPRPASAAQASARPPADSPLAAEAGAPGPAGASAAERAALAQAGPTASPSSPAADVLPPRAATEGVAARNDALPPGLRELAAEVGGPSAQGAKPASGAPAAATPPPPPDSLGGESPSDSRPAPAGGTATPPASALASGGPSATGSPQVAAALSGSAGAAPHGSRAASADSQGTHGAGPFPAAGRDAQAGAGAEAAQQSLLDQSPAGAPAATSSAAQERGAGGPHAAVAQCTDLAGSGAQETQTSLAPAGGQSHNQPPAAAGAHAAQGAGNTSGTAALPATAQVAQAPSFQTELATGSTLQGFDTAGALSRQIEQLQAKISLARAQGSAQAKISLTPAALGSMRIHLTQTEAGLIARVSAESALGSQALASARGDLQQALGSLGVTLLQLDIGAHGGERRGGGGAGGNESAGAGLPVAATAGAQVGGIEAEGQMALSGGQAGSAIDILA